MVLKSLPTLGITEEETPALVRDAQSQKKFERRRAKRAKKEQLF